MKTFIMRNLKARTTPDFNLNNLAEAGRLDIVVSSIANALFVSNNIRKDTEIHICLDGPDDPPKIVSFFGSELNLSESTEKSIAEALKSALQKGRGLKLNEEVKVQAGIIVSKKSFEALVKEKAKTSQLIYLHQEGKDIREAEVKENVTFVFGDYIGLPKKTELLLDKLGAERISIGPEMLFASHCVVIVNNELDRRE